MPEKQRPLNCTNTTAGDEQRGPPTEMEVSKRNRKADSLIRLLPDKEHDVHGWSESQRQMWQKYMWIYDERGANGDKDVLYEPRELVSPQTLCLRTISIRSKSSGLFWETEVVSPGDVRRHIFSVWMLDELVVQVIQRLFSSEPIVCFL